MINRGERRVVFMQVTAGEYHGIENLVSASAGTNGTYVDTHVYIDLEETCPVVDMFLERYEEVDIVCFFC